MTTRRAREMPRKFLEPRDRDSQRVVVMRNLVPLLVTPPPYFRCYWVSF
jgi:hypothetical protein